MPFSVDGLTAWLRARSSWSDVSVVGHERPSVGFSSATFMVDLRRGGANERVVVKLAPTDAGIFPTYDFALQAAAQRAAGAAGIPVPSYVEVETDPQWMGEPFLTMPAVDGHIIAEMPIRDHWLTKVDSSLAATAYGNYIDVLASINRVAPPVGVPARDNAAEIAYWRSYLDWYADGARLVPALEDALEWCATHAPSSEPTPSLLWGDVRMGNVIYDESRAPVAVLDWEMATIGSAEHDLAWALSLEGIQDELIQRRVEGFLSRDEAMARYSARLGRELCDFEWYEIFAIVRSTAIMTRIAYLSKLAGEPEFFPIDDNPILGILQRRIAEAS